MRITDLLLHQISGPYTGPIFEPGNCQANAVDVYPELAAARSENMNSLGKGDQLSAIYLEIQTDEGLSGFWGPIDAYQAFPIWSTLRPFLLGRDPLASELLFDQMWRLDRHGRSGYLMTAISAVDCALWDLRGKAAGLPVYRLLGGPTRRQLPAYASMLGYSIDPDDAAATARSTKDLGYSAQKWFFRYGPAHGEAGKRKNLEMAYAVRESVGPDYKLMFDAFMGWDLAYATSMVQALEAVRPTWMEEPIQPERVDAFVELRRASTVPIATGEHVYTRWQTRELLVNHAVDVLQNDPDWTGGITELIKICALASAFDVPVIPHGHSLLPALHVAAAQSPNATPYVEFLIRFQETKQYFHRTVLRPENGHVALPEGAGLGFEFDETKITGRTLLDYS